MFTPPAGQFTKIGAGHIHSLAIRTDGTIACWGSNSNGQSTPPADLGTVTEVDGGEAHSMALRSDGIVLAWGDNDLGQLDAPPAYVLGELKQIAAGCGHHSVRTVPPAKLMPLIPTNTMPN